VTGRGEAPARLTSHARAPLGLLLLLAVALAGCSIPSWIPLIGSNKPLGPDAAPSPPSKQATAPLLSATPAAGTPIDPDSVLDRVICVVN